MKRSIVLLLALLWPAAAQAGLTGSFTFSSAYDSNPDRTSIGESGFFTEASARLDNEWTRERWSGAFSLEGAGFIFPGSPERNYTRQNARAAIGWRPSDKSQLRAGFGVGGRSGREAYSIYDYRELDAFVEGKRKLGSRGAFLGGYAFRQGSYESLAVYDSAEHRLYTQLDLPAGERVTIGIYNEVGWKFCSEDCPSPGFGKKKGREAPVAGQWSGLLRLSAPLGERTGLRLSVQRHLDFGDHIGRARFAVDNYLAGEELYDDRYSYESREFGVQVSQRIGKSVIVRAGYDLAFKEYQQKAMNLDRHPVPGAGRRNDRQERLTLRIEKSWKKQRKPCVTKLYAEGVYLCNSSDDLLYDYSELVAGAGVAVEF